jgi:hypothetical protein
MNVSGVNFSVARAHSGTSAHGWQPTSSSGVSGTGLTADPADGDAALMGMGRWGGRRRG